MKTKQTAAQKRVAGATISMGFAKRLVAIDPQPLNVSELKWLKGFVFFTHRHPHGNPGFVVSELSTGFGCSGGIAARTRMQAGQRALARLKKAGSSGWKRALREAKKTIRQAKAK